MLGSVFHLLQTVIGKYTGLTRLLHPAILHITVTNRCSLKCGMCNVWKEEPKQDIPREVIRALTGSRFFNDFRVIEFGGGEPFLVDLPELTREFIPAGVRMILVTTNGWATGRVVEQVQRLLDLDDLSLVLNVSIDGLEPTHDRLRGIPGSFKRARDTLEKLADLKKNAPTLRVGIKFTFLADNYREIWSVYLMARELGVEFTAKPAAAFGTLHNREMDFSLTPDQVGDISTTLQKIDEDQARRTDFSRMNLFGRLYFFSNLIFNRLQREYLRRNILKGSVNQIIPCFSSFFSVLVHIDGGVYCCPTLMKEVGRLPRESFDDVWEGDGMRSIRRYIHEGRCSCFSQCDQMPSLVVRYPFRLGWEIVKSCFSVS